MHSHRPPAPLRQAPGRPHSPHEGGRCLLRNLLQAPPLQLRGRGAPIPTVWRVQVSAGVPVEMGVVHRCPLRTCEHLLDFRAIIGVSLQRQGSRSSCRAATT